ncbi:MurR/RpiR family transcriptional regulator [Acidaminococcus sp. LBK-2]|uniref:MurR/RpiR family transcriptional regulator n=1 Tax=Acidaminococcus sp. LBK-2 TaxID=3456956 RepID=UPI003FA4248A
MDENQTIKKNIREMYEKLSKSQKILASYIIKNYSLIMYTNILDMSKGAGVSPATITRFVRILGYSSFSDFQKKAIQENEKRVPFSQLKRMFQGAEKFNKDSNQIFRIISNNIKLLEQLYTPELQIEFEKSIDILKRAKTIYIAGQRSSYTVAYYLAFMLGQMKDNIHLISLSVGMLPSELSNVQKEDCLIMISYARYTSISAKICEYFKKKNAPIILITDNAISPIAINADEVLLAPNGEHFSPICAITLCNCFIATLGSVNTDMTLDRMKRQDKIALEMNIYV